MSGVICQKCDTQYWIRWSQGVLRRGDFVMKWSEMSEPERDRFVHEKVMGLQIEVCSGDEQYKEWDESVITCTNCKVPIHVADGEWQHIKHGTVPIPKYSRDMNAAMDVLRRMFHPAWCEMTMFFINYLGEHEAIDKSAISIEPIFSLYQLAHLTADKICFAAAKVFVPEIER
jgi:hypothetical protein